MRRRLIVLALMAPAGAPAAAQDPVVISPGPDHVALTLYRAPDGNGAIDLRWLGGFALVTETRRLRLPAGPATVRFEGVAEAIVPVSAIIDGLPGGTIEKNRDARLLSPASLVDGTLGRQVTLTRTERTTGKAVSETATIVAGPDPGVILRTTKGIETLRCSGLPERLAFPAVPDGLSSKPVLSVRTSTPSARTVTVRLSYLASGFDWRASYVATLAVDGRTLDLFAWLTLANANPQAFADADVQAVAGRVNRAATPDFAAAAAALRLVCYPLGTTTSDLHEQVFEPASQIIVTASLKTFAPMMMGAPAPPPPPPPEDLGDLKLYRVPAPTTVAANAQKQVALLVQAGVPFERHYRRAVAPGQSIAAAPTAIVLVLRNERTAGLGVALPAGSTAAFAPHDRDRLLLGLGTMTDRAVGETFRLAAGVSRQVQIDQKIVAPDEAELTVSNANRFPVTLDLPIGDAGQGVAPEGAIVGRVDGIVTWSPVIPSGGSAVLRYRY